MKDTAVVDRVFDSPWSVMLLWGAPLRLSRHHLVNAGLVNKQDRRSNAGFHCLTFYSFKYFDSSLNTFGLFSFSLRVWVILFCALVQECSSSQIGQHCLWSKERTVRILVIFHIFLLIGESRAASVSDRADGSSDNGRMTSHSDCQSSSKTFKVHIKCHGPLSHQLLQTAASRRRTGHCASLWSLLLISDHNHTSV